MKPYAVEYIQKDESRWMPALLYVYLIAALMYIVWRTGNVNWQIWYGPVLYVAELYGLVCTALFLLTSQKAYIPNFRRPGNEKSVDVLIPTYNEPLSILEPVVAAARDIWGVRNILLLDDGNRSEVLSMSTRLGVSYYARTDNEHAKAGNLNNGLKYTDADFLILLDADHIPKANFIEQTIGYFEDSKLAFVQSPQTFYNVDSFLFRSRRGRPAEWSEQGMFYGIIQPAKNRWNSAFFVGTSAIMRREAIDSVGGFATGTATEDIHTSLKLHAKGWKSIFLDIPLAYGLEAESFKEFYKQRKRWAAGSLGLLFRSADSPIRARGLSVMQRLNYLSATLAHLQGVQKMCYFVIPITTVFWGVSPVQGSVATYSALFFIFVALSVGSTWAYSRGTYHFIYNEMYSLANMLAHFGGIKGIIKVQKKFAVSNKSSSRNEQTWLVNVLWIMFSLAVIALLWSITKFFTTDSGQSLHVYLMAFITANGMVLVSFLVHLRRYEHRRNQNEVMMKRDGYAIRRPVGQGI